MIVITLTDCPPKVRGDLSKWLYEINTGVYVGSVSARVREEVWQRVCEQLKTGRATMVYTAGGEQGLDFRLHNTAWEIADYDGLKLVRRPAEPGAREGDQPYVSNAAVFQMLRRKQTAAQRALPASYTVIDLETTGLMPEKDSILELAALRVEEGAAAQSFQALVRPEGDVPQGIRVLTGITPQLLREQAGPLEPALRDFLAFLDGRPVVGHHVAFDIAFLKIACRRYDLPLPRTRILDTMDVAKRRLPGLNDWKLETLCAHLGIDTAGMHRAARDCELIHQAYEKLNEIT